MGRRPCCAKEGLNRGAWTAAEDKLLTQYIQQHGEGKWRSLPKRAGLRRCGKSCRLRWLNYLRPDIKRGNISHEEEELIIRLHNLLGNRWSLIAGRLPGRTDNEIKNYWNTNLGKKVKNQPSPASANYSPARTKKPRSSGAPSSKMELEVVRTKAVRCTKVFISTPQQQLIDACTDAAVEAQKENTDLGPRGSCLDHHDEDSSLGELSLSELLSSGDFQIEEACGLAGDDEPFLLNQEMMQEDWGDGCCSALEMDAAGFDIFSFLNSELESGVV